MLEVVEAQDVVGRAHEVAAIGHGPDGGDGAGDGGEAQGAGGRPAAACLVDVKLLHDAVAAAGVDGVAGGRPARGHAPGGHAALGRDARDGVGGAAVPDADGSVYRGGEEG